MLCLECPVLSGRKCVHHEARIIIRGCVSAADGCRPQSQAWTGFVGSGAVSYGLLFINGHEALMSLKENQSENHRLSEMSSWNFFWPITFKVPCLGFFQILSSDSLNYHVSAFQSGQFSIQTQSVTNSDLTEIWPREFLCIFLFDTFIQVYLIYSKLHFLWCTVWQGLACVCLSDRDHNWRSEHIHHPKSFHWVSPSLPPAPHQTTAACSVVLPISPTQWTRTAYKWVLWCVHLLGLFSFSKIILRNMDIECIYIWFRFSKLTPFRVPRWEILLLWKLLPCF